MECPVYIRKTSKTHKGKTYQNLLVESVSTPKGPRANDPLFARQFGTRSPRALAGAGAPRRSQLGGTALMAPVENGAIFAGLGRSQ